MSAPPFRENLLKFPHLAAIQHNNCMYLAHHLLTLGHHFRAHLPQQLSEGVATFVDMVPGFRKLGKQILFQLVALLPWYLVQKWISKTFMVHRQQIIICWPPLLCEISTSNLQIALKYTEHTCDICPPGAQCFLTQMNVQRAELLERLSTAHNFCNLDDEDNYIAASKAVRQVKGSLLCEATW